MNLPVTSREYKIMLNPQRFDDLERGRATLIKLVEFIVLQHSGSWKFDNNPPERRTVRYLDTAARHLAAADMSLRLREEEDGATKLTLKHRASDRYCDGSLLVVATSPDADLKFEEDIIPPFGCKFSRSATVKLAAPPN